MKSVALYHCFIVSLFHARSGCIVAGTAKEPEQLIHHGVGAARVRSNDFGARLVLKHQAHS